MRIYIHANIHIHLHIYVYVCVYMYRCKPPLYIHPYMYADTREGMTTRTHLGRVRGVPDRLPTLAQP